MGIRTSVSAVRRSFALLGALVLVCGVVPLGSAAPVSAATIDVPYTQNFDTLPASGSATWVSDSTIPGWFHARTGTGTTIVANDGSSNAGNLYSYGTGTATDRALSDKVLVIRNWSHIDELSGISLESRTEMRRGFGWPDDVTVVLHAGNMGAKQGLANVVEAARVAHRDNNPLLFVLMGDGNQRATLEAMVAAGHLKFVDPVPQELFTAVLGAADILMVNERRGVKDMSVPSKLTSYFATGRPVIAATDARSVTAEEIEASGAGIRVDADRPELIVKAAMELRNNSEMARELGRKGLEFRRSHLTADASLDSFHKLLLQLARNSSDGPDLDELSRQTEQMKGSELV